MKRVWIAHSVVITTIVTITLMAVFAGRILNLAPITLQTTGDCQLPCWNGLHPGKTHVTEAGAILRELGYQPRVFDPDPILTNTSFVTVDGDVICEVHLNPMPGGFFDQITLRACNALPVGDILGVIGQPESMLPLASVIVFKEGQMILFLHNKMCEAEQVSIYAPIRYILLADEGVNATMVNQPSDLPWHGFLPFWRYSQLYPQKMICPYQ